MITHLKVRHLAVVEDVSITFNDGMTSLTGETGAGKSILVDALGLVLGDRADSGMIRHDHQRAEIEASFAIDDNLPLQQWLIENELDDEQQCHLRRTVSHQGSSRGYINGRSVPIAQLRIIGEFCVNIHGQHAHQALLKSDTQRMLLDHIAGNQQLLAELAEADKLRKATSKALGQQQSQLAQQNAQRELLQYQVEELSTFQLTSEYISHLIQQQKKLAHGSQLIGAVEAGLHQLNEQDGSAYQLISRVIGELTPLVGLEPQLDNTVEALNSALIQLDDSSNDLRHYLDNAELDPQLFNEVEQELAALHQLARKHQVEIEALPEYYQTLIQQLDEFDHTAQQSQQLEQQLARYQAHCLELCQEIAQNRRANCQPLADKITAIVQSLAMPNGSVSFDISPMPAGQFNETGADIVRLLVSTNAKQAPKEIGKVASGGELARISLAIQVVTSTVSDKSTLVFDEVDVGIGGGIAEIVGRHLRSLAASRQVICITHLPQVAAQAHHQVQVSKYDAKESTAIALSELSSAQRVEEIARMLGGVNITEKTRDHAQEMLNLAD